MDGSIAGCEQSYGGYIRGRKAHADARKKRYENAEKDYPAGAGGLEGREDTSTLHTDHHSMW